MAKKGDVLMSVRVPVGDINIANTDCSIDRGIASIRSKDKNSSFLFYTMRELYFELNQFNSEGTVFGSINKDELFSLKVAKPEKEIIEKFERQISKIDLIIMHNEKELAILRKMRNLIIR